MNDPIKVQKALDAALAAEPAYRPARALRAARLVLDRETARAADELTGLIASDQTDLESCGLAMFVLNVLKRFEQTLATCPAAGRDVGVDFERAVGLEGAGRAREMAPFYAELHRAPVEKLGDLSWRSWRYLEEVAM
jgi:hypothetical protein